MSKLLKKRKFANNQIVVFRYGNRKLVGKVVFARPVGKQFTYDVLCEDSKIYSELGVDLSYDQCIDTYLTKLFYQKYKIDPAMIPDATEVVNVTVDNVQIDSIEEEASQENASKDADEGLLFEDEDSDPNY